MCLAHQEGETDLAVVIGKKQAGGNNACSNAQLQAHDHNSHKGGHQQAILHTCYPLIRQEQPVLHPPLERISCQSARQATHDRKSDNHVHARREALKGGSAGAEAAMYCSMCTGCNKQGLAPLPPWGSLESRRRNAVRLVALLSPFLLYIPWAAQLQCMQAML